MRAPGKFAEKPWQGCWENSGLLVSLLEGLFWQLLCGRGEAWMVAFGCLKRFLSQGQCWEVGEAPEARDHWEDRVFQIPP